MYTAYIDLDGTLLDDNKRISCKTYGILSDFIKCGNNIVIATARSMQLNGLQEEIRLLTPHFIFHNGGQIISDNKVIKRYFFSNEEVKHIGRFLSDRGIRAALITDNGYFANYDAPQKWGHIPNFHYTDFSNVSTSAPKFSLIIDSDIQLSDIQRLNDKAQITYIDNGTGAIISPKGVDKGTAIQFMQDRLFQTSESIYFGNDLNDLPAFFVSDIRVAVENAEYEIKEAADYITSSNNRDGVALFLQKLMDGQYRKKERRSFL